MVQPRDWEEALRVPDQEAWRRWLSNNHHSVSSVWLTIRKKAARGPGIGYEDAVDEAVCFGWIDGKMHSIDEASYALRFSPRRTASIWSLANRERAERLMCAGKMSAAGLAEITKAKQNGRWKNAYTSKEKPVVPPDLQQALRQNPEAWRKFNGFANSYQTMYVGWVVDAKRQSTRENRIREVISRCQAGKKPG